MKTKTIFLGLTYVKILPGKFFNPKLILLTTILAVILVMLNSCDHDPKPLPIPIPEPHHWVVSTLAGSTAGYLDGDGVSAQFSSPLGIAVDVNKNIYVTDYGNNIIRKISANGIVSTLAGSGTAGNGDGTGINAQFRAPVGIAVDGQGNVYVADNMNHRIRKITPDGVVTTLAGSVSGYLDDTGALAKFTNPTGVAVDKLGNVYVTDQLNYRIRKITPGGVVSTFAGSGAHGFQDGVGTAASFNIPAGITIDSKGNLFITDQLNHAIRKITPDGTVSTIAGNGGAGFDDGIGASATFNNPMAIAVDSDGNLFVVDHLNHSIRTITPDGHVLTISGGSPGFSDGDALTALFYYPYGIGRDSNGKLYIADRDNNRIRILQ
jgi:sugar lactone lactonase YvrE